MKRGRLGTALLVLVVVILISCLAILAGISPNKDVSPGTPSHAITEFLAALDRGDDLEAYGWLSEDISSHFSFEAFTRDVRSAESSGRMARIAVAGVTEDGSRAIVDLDVVRVSGSSRFLNHHRVALVYEDDAWKIDEYLTYL